MSPSIDAVVGRNEFPGTRVNAPEPVDGATVLHVIDPSGVLLVFVH